MRNNRLIEYGKAAVLLCNDWRDSIFYTGIAATATANTALGWGISPSEFALIAAQREGARFVAWGGLKHLVGVGPTIPNYRHVFSAASTMGALFLAKDFMAVSEKILRAVKPSVPDIGANVFMDLVMLGGGLIYGGGAKAVVKDYRDTLWDWPRKNKPPGGRRNIILERFHDLADWVRDTVRPPRPAWGVASIAAAPVADKAANG